MWSKSVPLICCVSSLLSGTVSSRGQGQTCEIMCAFLFSYCSEEGSVMYLEAHAFALRFAHSPYTRHRHGNRLRDGNEVTRLAHLSLKHWKYSFNRHQMDTWDSSSGSLAVIRCEVFFSCPTPATNHTLITSFPSGNPIYIFVKKKKKKKYIYIKIYIYRCWSYN